MTKATPRRLFCQQAYHVSCHCHVIAHWAKAHSESKQVLSLDRTCIHGDPCKNGMIAQIVFSFTEQGASVLSSREDLLRVSFAQALPVFCTASCYVYWCKLSLSVGVSDAHLQIARILIFICTHVDNSYRIKKKNCLRYHQQTCINECQAAH